MLILSSVFHRLRINFSALVNPESKKIAPIKASMTMNLEPVSSILLGFLILNQSLTNQQILGSAIVIISILLIQIS